MPFAARPGLTGRGCRHCTERCSPVAAPKSSHGRTGRMLNSPPSKRLQPMPIHLVLPGLLWPAAAARNFARDLPLPALSTLLGHARIEFTPGRAADARLAEIFGLGADAPVATLRRTGEPNLAPPEPGRAWLCADPVCLHFAREHLILSDASGLDLSIEEAAALVAALNETFSDLGHFEAGAPDRWYLRLAAPTNARFSPLSDVTNRPVGHFLPEGPDAALWARTMNEVQIVLHNHPVNQAREAAGRPIANSLWLWGAGGDVPSLRAPAPTVLARGPVARGLALAAGLETGSPALPRGGADVLIVLEDLLGPVLHIDLDRWRDTLLALEAAWFAPLLGMLQARRANALRISAPGDRATLEIAVAASQLWKFWRKPRNLEDLAAPGAPAPASSPNHSSDP